MVHMCTIDMCTISKSRQRVNVSQKIFQWPAACIKGNPFLKKPGAWRKNRQMCRECLLRSFVALLLLGLLASCTDDKGVKFSPALPSDDFKVSAPAKNSGIGLPAIAPTPARFPKHTAEDMKQMFATSAEIAKAAVFISQWSDENLFEHTTRSVAAARERGLQPIIGLSPTTLDQGRKELDLPAKLRWPGASFGDADVKAAFVKAAEELARLKVPYLCLAPEINLLGLQRIDEYVRFAAAYKEAYRAAKKIAPETKVFVTFQYEFIRVVDNREPNKVVEHAKLIEIFRPELDLVGITSYPSGFYETPAALPANYYSHLKQYLKPGDEVMLMEVGWPSSGPGTPDEQAQFVRRLPQLLAGISPKATAWSLLHDVKLSAFGADLATTGLLAADGSEKPALRAWKELAK
jgi:hypothetical protein